MCEGMFVGELSESRVLAVMRVCNSSSLVYLVLVHVQNGTVCCDSRLIVADSHPL